MTGQDCSATAEDINVSGQKEVQGKTSRTNRGGSCIGDVRVEVDAAGAIRLRRVLGFNWHPATIGIPTSLVVLLDVNKVGLSGAPPATGDCCNDQAEEDDP